VIRYRQRGWAVPLFEQKVLTDANYEALTNLILSQTSLIRRLWDAQSPYVGPHRGGCGIAKAPSRDWEYQMIYAMAEPFQHAVTQHGRRLRALIPRWVICFQAWPISSAIAENTSNEIVPAEGVCGIPVFEHVAGSACS